VRIFLFFLPIYKKYLQSHEPEKQAGWRMMAILIIKTDFGSLKYATVRNRAVIESIYGLKVRTACRKRAGQLPSQTLQMLTLTRPLAAGGSDLVAQTVY
jgi:hypothetical protein